MLRRHGLALTAALLVISSPTVPRAASAPGQEPARQGTQATPAAKPKKPPSAKMSEPWPTAAKMLERRTDAERRRLFRESDPLVFTLAADFKAVNRDRNQGSTKTFPAVLTVAGDQGAPAPLTVTLRTRGKLRLDPRTCAFVPLSIEFTKKEAKGTAFDGQRTLKLVTHCQNDQAYDQYVLREYLTYRLFNLFTPRSFRARLARATYTDSASGKTLSTHYAVFIEDEDDLARRLDGRVLALPRTQFRDYDTESLTLMALFQYMIGNTDYSIFALHNVRMVQTQAKLFYPITWDFDVSGLVGVPYGGPDPRLEISSLRDRLYRGPCRTMEEFEPSLAIFRAKQAEALALFDSLPDLRDFHRREARQFLAQFYTKLERKNELKKDLVDKCQPNPTM